MTQHSPGSASLVSIGIPTYNGSRHIRETLLSALAQTHRSLEIIVVDDGSTDDTFSVLKEIAEDDPRIILVRQENHGIASARNACYASGSPDAEYFLFLDHDDLLQPDAVEVLLDALVNRPDCAAAHGRTEVIDEEGRRTAPDPEMIARLGLQRRQLHGTSLRDALRSAPPLPDSKDTTFATLLYANCITSVGAVLFRKSALDSAGGGFLAEFVPNDEWELYLRVARQGAFAFVPRTVLQWRRHFTNTSGNATGMRDAYLRLFRHLAALPLRNPYRRQLRAALLYRAAAMLSVIVAHPNRVTTERGEIGRVLGALVKAF